MCRFDYESYADYSAGGEMTYMNTSSFCDVSANAEFKSKKDVKAKIKKTNGEESKKRQKKQVEEKRV